MRCPFCHSAESRVLESRLLEEETCLRRRRECAECTRRFTTYERIETVPLMVIKRDGSRQGFDAAKLSQGIMRACVKCSVTATEIERIVLDVEADLSKRFVREILSTEIGELVLARLRDLDEVAYVRFASVYRSFSSIEDFIAELSSLRAGALS
ncbi:Transcriptional repressor NrdR [compost metagenome]